MYIDSHAHIYLDEFKNDLAKILNESTNSGIDTIYMPNIDTSTVASLHRVEEQYQQCKAMMGLHPCYVKEDYKDQLSEVVSWIEKRKYSALGEVGIDLYWDKTYVEEQIEAFNYQISLAKEHDLAVIIHSRDSLELTIEAIAKNQNGSLRGIFHCFNGTIDQGKQIEDLGFHIGIGGVVTFKNSGVDKTIAKLNITNFVLETDAPYLAPVPYRGKQNSPSYLPFIAQKIAEVKKINIERVAKITTDNCRSIFNY